MAVSECANDPYGHVLISDSYALCWWLHILQGDVGADSLTGGLGDDVYHFGLGDGQDNINNQDSEGNDSVAFGNNVDKHDLRLSQSSYDLRVEILGTDYPITLESWYLNDHQKVDQFELQDGNALNRNEVDQLVNAMAGFNPDTFGAVDNISDLPTTVQDQVSATWN